MKQTLVMGIGNLLLSDDGVGVHAVKALAHRQLPDEVVLLDVGTAFLDALPDLEGAERIIVIDAVRAQGRPGQIYRLPVEKCAPREMAGLHDFDIFGMLAMAENRREVEVIVVGMEPERFGWGLDLSPSVFKALPLLLDKVCEELEI